MCDIDTIKDIYENKTLDLKKNSKPELKYLMFYIMQVLLFIGDERHERRGWGSFRLIHCFMAA